MLVLRARAKNDFTLIVLSNDDYEKGRIIVDLNWGLVTVQHAYLY